MVALQEEQPALQEKHALVSPMEKVPEEQGVHVLAVLLNPKPARQAAQRPEVGSQDDDV